MDIICGQGRLGRRVADALAARGRPPHPMRIAGEQGLTGLTSSPCRLSLLVICLVPPHPEGGSGWTGLLDGLSRQLQRGAIAIDRILLVSSTAVYNSHRVGWVDARTPVQPDSPRTAGLIEAERCVQTLAPTTIIARLAGITGPGYERYDPLAMSAQQPRHAIDVRAAALQLADWALAPMPPRCALLTDGVIYWRGAALAMDDPVLTDLAAAHRLLRRSEAY